MAKDAYGNEIPLPPNTVGGPAIADNFGIIQGITDALPKANPDPSLAHLAGGVRLNDNFGVLKGVAPGDFSSAPKEEKGFVDDQVFPGTPGQMQGHNDNVDAIEAEFKLYEGLSSGGPAPKAFYAPAHTEYSQLGAERGKELFQTAYGDGPNDGPTKLQNAVRESEAAQGQKNEAMAKFYDAESARATEAAAARKMSAQRDMEEMRVRQENMEKATQHYTNDMADTGRFWTNPGNIIAAISFSLMPIFSNDPTVGVKLINQAIQQDLEHRRVAGQGTLGALQSNLAGYHKIVGDRQAGDQLAEAEARRVAAMEVERIAAKFESPISKAKAEAIIQDLRMKQAQGYMTAFSQAKIFQQAQKQDPQLYAMRTKGYPGAWQGVNDVAPIEQSVGARANGTIGGSPSQATQSGGFTEHVSRADQAILNVASPARAAQLALEGRVPGSANMFALAQRFIHRTATNKAKGLSYGPAYQAARDEVLADARKEILSSAELRQNLGGRKATLADILHSAEIIRASEGAAGRDPNAWFGKAKTLLGEELYNKYDTIARAFQTNEGLSPAAARAKTRDLAVQQFRQKLAGQISAAYSDISGGAISNTELPRLEASIKGGESFGFVYDWLQIRSKEIADKENTAIKGMSPIAQMVYMTRTGVGQRPHGMAVRPIPGPAKAPEGTGEFNAGRSSSTEPTMSIDPRMSNGR